MSANNFARQQWVSDLIEDDRLRALPQYTYTDYHFRGSLITVNELTRLLKRSQTEYSRLSGVTSRITKTNELLKAGTYSKQKQEELDREEQDEFSTYVNSYDEKVFQFLSREVILKDLESQHQLIDGERKKIRDAEKENARLQKEAAEKLSAGIVKEGEATEKASAATIKKEEED